MELETHLQISLRLGFVSEQVIADILSQTGEIGKMISGLRNSLAYQTREPNPESSILTPNPES